MTSIHLERYVHFTLLLVDINLLATKCIMYSLLLLLFIHFALTINGCDFHIQKLVGCKEMGEEVLKSVDSQVPASA